MITAPANWTNLYDTTDSHMELKVNIGGTDYYGENMAAGDFKIEHALYEAFGIGNVCSAQFSVTLLDITGTIPDGIVKVIPYCRLSNADRTQYTDWVKQGEFYLDTINEDIEQDTVAITAYDALLLAEQDYYDDGEGASDTSTWPKQCSAVVSEICTKLGISLDSRSQIGTGEINKPEYKTIREVLSEIAILSGGNWTMTKAGQLRLIPLTGQVTSAVSTINSVSDIRITSNPTMISQLILKKSGSEKFIAGTITDYTVEGTYDGATQEITDAIFLQITGKLYQGFSVTDAYFDPLLEIGDPVQITLGENSWYIPFDSYSCLYEEGCWGDIAAPLDMEVQHRIRYTHSQASKTDRQIKQAVKEAKEYTDEKASGGGGDDPDYFYYRGSQKITFDAMANNTITIPPSSTGGTDGETLYFWPSASGQDGGSVYCLPKIKYNCWPLSENDYELTWSFTGVQFNYRTPSRTAKERISEATEGIHANVWLETPSYYGDGKTTNSNAIRYLFVSKKNNPRDQNGNPASGLLKYCLKIKKSVLYGVT